MSRNSKTTLDLSYVLTEDDCPQITNQISLAGTIGLVQSDDGSETIAVIGAKDLGEIYFTYQDVFENVN